MTYVGNGGAELKVLSNVENLGEAVDDVVVVTRVKSKAEEAALLEVVRGDVVFFSEGLADGCEDLGEPSRLSGVTEILSRLVVSFVSRGFNAQRVGLVPKHARALL